MVYEFKLPDIGEGLTEAEVIEWMVKEGDHVQEHQVMAKMETDKAVAELPTPKSGTVLKLSHKPGDMVKVGETLFVLGEKGETFQQTQQQQQPRPVEARPVESKPAPVFKPAGAVGYLEEAQTVEQKTCSSCGARFDTQDQLNNHVKSAHPQKLSGQSHVLVTPALRNLAKEMNVDLNRISGSGQGGRITEDDVRRYNQPAVRQPVARKEISESEVQIEIKSERKYDFYGHVNRVPFKGLRRATAMKMVESKQHIPHVTHMDEADVTDLWKWRDDEKLVAADKGIKLTFMPYVIKAVIAAMRDFMMMNSSLDEEKEEILVKEYFNIGFATDTGDGLVVPVIKAAETKDVFQLAKEMQDLSEKARAKTINAGDMKGGTFTVTNIGSIGGMFATPVINYPECAILGLGRIYDKVVVEDDKLKVRKYLPMSFAFDHRIVDGAYVARFANAVIEKLERPDELK